jgi:hypothetical protein
LIKSAEEQSKGAKTTPDREGIDSLTGFCYESNQRQTQNGPPLVNDARDPHALCLDGAVPAARFSPLDTSSVEMSRVETQVKPAFIPLLKEIGVPEERWPEFIGDLTAIIQSVFDQAQYDEYQ